MKSAGTCPQCGEGQVIPTWKGYACERAREQPPCCGFKVRLDWLRGKITLAEMTALIEGREVKHKEGPLLKLVEGWLRAEVGECPQCGEGTVLGTRGGYRCDREPQCAFRMSVDEVAMVYQLSMRSLASIMSALLAGRTADLPDGRRLRMAMGQAGRIVLGVEVGPCRWCGQGRMLDSRGTYWCDRALECGVEISCGALAQKAELSREIAPSEMAVLLATGEVELPEGIRLRLESDAEEPVTLLTNAGTCPRCEQGRVWHSKDGHECARAPACDFAMSHAGLPWAPTLEEVVALLDGRKVDLSEDLCIERRNNRAGTMALFAAVRRGSLRSDVPARGDDVESPGDAETGRWKFEMSEGVRLVAARPGSGEAALSVEVGTCPQCQEGPALWHPRCVFCGGPADGSSGCDFRVYQKFFPRPLNPKTAAALLAGRRIDIGNGARIELSRTKDGKVDPVLCLGPDNAEEGRRPRRGDSPPGLRVGACPQCDGRGRVVSLPSSHRCERGLERVGQCDFMVHHGDLPRAITAVEMAGLLTGMEVELTEQARLALSETEDGKVDPALRVAPGPAPWEERARRGDSPAGIRVGLCPKCGAGRVFASRTDYRCERGAGRPTRCGFRVAKEDLPEGCSAADMGMLLARGEVTVDGTRLRLRDGRVVTLDFDEE